MPKRIPFSKEEEDRMIAFVLKEHRQGNPDVEKRYGLKLWEKAALEGLTNHGAKGMKQHLLIPRMKERLEAALAEEQNSTNEYVVG